MGRPKHIDWEGVSDLGLVPDSVIAERFSVSPSAVGHARRLRGVPVFRKVDWDSVCDLGMSTDSAISERLGVQYGLVWEARRRRGIQQRKVHSIMWNEVDELGRVPDSEVAKRLGVTQSSVSRARRRLGIVSFRDNQWMLPGGVTVTTQEIASHFDCKRETARRRLFRGWLGANRVGVVR